MKVPDLKCQAGIFLFTWPEENISVKLDRIREDSRHTVSAEVIFKTTSPGIASHLHQARLNLLSTSSRKATAKYLTERLDFIDWAGVIEQVCTLTLARYREGERAVRMSDVKAPEGLQYKVPPLILERETNLLYGPGGIGKSYLATFLEAIIDAGIIPSSSTGHPFFEFEPGPGKCLYLDYETSVSSMWRRLNRIYKGLKCEVPSNILYRFCAAPFPSEIEEIQRIVVENNIDFVVVDSIGTACGGEPESAGVTLAFFAALRSLRITALCIDHVAKNSDSKTPFGSVYKFNQARNIWELKKSQDEGSNSIALGLYHRKINDGPLLKPFGLLMTFTEDAVTFTPQNLADVPEMVGTLTFRQRMAIALKTGKLSVHDLVLLVNDQDPQAKALTEDTASAYLSKYKEFTLVGNGLWGLLESRLS